MPVHPLRCRCDVGPFGQVVADSEVMRHQTRLCPVVRLVGKAGLMALTQQLALELAPTIRVNAVAPGLALPPDSHSQQQIERFAQRVPLARWGSPEDVAQAVKYLIEADFVTGEVLRVDGGEKII